MNEAVNDWHQCTMTMSSPKLWLEIGYLFHFLHCALCISGFLIHFSIYRNAIHNLPQGRKNELYMQVCIIQFNSEQYSKYITQPDYMAPLKSAFKSNTK